MNIEDYANMTAEEHAYYEGKAECIAELKKYKEFYNASVAEHRKSIELIDSLERQIEVLRPVYEAAKDFKGAWDYNGTKLAVETTRDNVFRAVILAARELEDTNE